MAGADASGDLERMLRAALRQSGVTNSAVEDAAEAEGGVDDVWDATDDWETIPSPLLAASPPVGSLERPSSFLLPTADGGDEVWDAADERWAPGRAWGCHQLHSHKLTHPVVGVSRAARARCSPPLLRGSWPLPATTARATPLARSHACCRRVWVPPAPPLPPSSRTTKDASRVE